MTAVFRRAPQPSSAIGMANGQVGVLRGLASISAYCGMSPFIVKRLRDDYGMPMVKLFGAYCTTPSLIDAWLLDQLDKQRNARRTIDVTATVVDND